MSEYDKRFLDPIFDPGSQGESSEESEEIIRRKCRSKSSPIPPRWGIPSHSYASDNEIKDKECGLKT
jgi:hypothetical protein